MAIEIPENYTGWITVHHSAQDCGHTEKSGLFQSVVQIRANGEGCSTRWQGTGSITAMSFYYVDSSGRRKRRLEETGWGEGGEIWGGASNSAKREYYIYVGSEAAFKNTPYPVRP